MSLFSFEDIIDFQQESKSDMVLSQIDVSNLTSALRKLSDSRGPKGFDPHQYEYPFRGGVQWQLQFNLRTSVERCSRRQKKY